MKFFAVILSSLAMIFLLCGEYEIDLRRGQFRFKSVEQEIEQNILVEFKEGQFIDLDIRVESQIGFEKVDPKPIMFRERNRLRNGDLLIVKKKLFGNNIEDGHRFVFYFYGAGDLGSCLNIMNTELCLDNKYHLHQFKKMDDYSWMEIRSNFVNLK